MTAYIAVELQHQVREHFTNYCAYCRTAVDLTVTTFEFEHILPLSAGGETTFVNLCLSCPMCNRYKSDQVLATEAVTQTLVRCFIRNKIDGQSIFPGTKRPRKSLV